jgi:hypothetical protein
MCAITTVKVRESSHPGHTYRFRGRQKRWPKPKNGANRSDSRERHYLLFGSWRSIFLSTTIPRMDAENAPRRGSAKTRAAAIRSFRSSHTSTITEKINPATDAKSILFQIPNVTATSIRLAPKNHGILGLLIPSLSKTIATETTEQVARMKLMKKPAAIAPTAALRSGTETGNKNDTKSRFMISRERLQCLSVRQMHYHDATC